MLIQSFLYLHPTQDSGINLGRPGGEAIDFETRSWPLLAIQIRVIAKPCKGLVPSASWIQTQLYPQSMQIISRCLGYRQDS